MCEAVSILCGGAGNLAVKLNRFRNSYVPLDPDRLVFVYLTIRTYKKRKTDD